MNLKRFRSDLPGCGVLADKRFEHDGNLLLLASWKPRGGVKQLPHLPGGGMAAKRLFLAKQFLRRMKRLVKVVRNHAERYVSLLEESLNRIHTDFGRYPSAVGADRGFDRGATRRKLRTHGIMNGICPRSVPVLQDRMQDEGFADIQRRRAQTEGRIGILKNNFLGPVLRNKGFESREREVAWAVLAHNLWILARMLRAQEKDRQEREAA